MFYHIINWTIANDQSNANYSVRNKKWSSISKEVLKFNHCDCNVVYILVKCDIRIIGYNVNQTESKILHHLLNVSQELIEQKSMILKICIYSCQCIIC